MTEYINTLKFHAGRKLGPLHFPYIKYLITFHQLHFSFCLRSITRCLCIRYLKTCKSNAVRNSYFSESHRCTVHFVKSLQLLTNKCTYITFTYNTLKHLKSLRHVSIFSDHHHGVSSFLAKVITYSRFSSFL